MVKLDRQIKPKLVEKVKEQLKCIYCNHRFIDIGSHSMNRIMCGHLTHCSEYKNHISNNLKSNHTNMKKCNTMSENNIIYIDREVLVNSDNSDSEYDLPEELLNQFDDNDMTEIEQEAVLIDYNISNHDTILTNNDLFNYQLRLINIYSPLRMKYP